MDKVGTISWKDLEITYTSGTFNIEAKGEDAENIRNLLDLFSKKLPRKPWEYTLGQKLRNGWFSQGITGAKKSWLKVIQ